jgi:hypothetical protein
MAEADARGVVELVRPFFQSFSRGEGQVFFNESSSFPMQNFLAQLDDRCYLAIDDAMRTERFPWVRAILAHLMQTPDFGDLPVMINVFEDDLDGVFSPISFTYSPAGSAATPLSAFLSDADVFAIFNNHRSPPRTPTPPPLPHQQSVGACRSLTYE